MVAMGQGHKHLGGRGYEVIRGQQRIHDLLAEWASDITNVTVCVEDSTELPARLVPLADEWVIRRLDAIPDAIVVEGSQPRARIEARRAAPGGQLSADEPAGMLLSLGPPDLYAVCANA